MKEIIFATDGIFPQAVGGMQRHSRLLIEALARREELRLTVIHPHQGETVFDPVLGIEEIAVPPLPSQRNYLLELHAYSKQVAAILRERPQALIYAQGLSVWHQVERFGPRLIINPHGLEPYQGLSLEDRLKGWPYRMIYLRLFNRAARVVSLGGRLTDILRKVMRDPQRLVVLPNATELPEGDWRGWLAERPERPIKVLFVGRFAHNKGIDVLMQAIAQVHEAGDAADFHFTLAGKGPLYEQIRSQYQFPNTELLGFVSDEQLADLYQTHHLFMLPTLFEGMPTVVLEAMAHAMVIAVTDVGATRELVDASNGYIIDKGSPTAIVSALRQMRDLSPAQRQAMGEASRAKVEARFTWPQVAGAHVEALDGI